MTSGAPSARCGLVEGQPLALDDRIVIVPVVGWRGPAADVVASAIRCPGERPVPSSGTAEEITGTQSVDLWPVAVLICRHGGVERLPIASAGAGARLPVGAESDTLSESSRAALVSEVFRQVTLDGGRCTLDVAQVHVYTDCGGRWRRTRTSVGVVVASGGRVLLTRV